MTMKMPFLLHQWEIAPHNQKRSVVKDDACNNYLDTLQDSLSELLLPLSEIVLRVYIMTSSRHQWMPRDQVSIARVQSRRPALTLMVVEVVLPSWEM
jgi:hypothetical protein